MHIGVVNRDYSRISVTRENVFMHRSTDGRIHYNLLILTNYYSKNLTTKKLLTIRLMAMLAVKSIVI